MKRGLVRTLIVLALLLAFLLLVYIFIGRPMIEFIGEPEDLQKYIDDQGVLGLLVFGMFVVIQTVFNCIPGLPFYLAAGYVWGGFKGALICDLFATIGNTIAFLLGKKLGRGFLNYLFTEEKLAKIDEMVEDGNPVFIHIIFMFLPLPKDTYAWVGYYSGEGVIQWFVITFIARFTQIFIYTYGGSKIADNQYIALILGSIFAVLVYVFAALYFRRKHKRRVSTEN